MHIYTNIELPMVKTVEKLSRRFGWLNFCFSQVGIKFVSLRSSLSNKAHLVREKLEFRQCTVILFHLITKTVSEYSSFLTFCEFFYFKLILCWCMWRGEQHRCTGHQMVNLIQGICIYKDWKDNHSDQITCIQFVVAGLWILDAQIAQILLQSTTILCAI